MSQPFSGNIFAERVCQFGIRTVSSQQRLEICLFDREQAIPKLAVGSETEAIAVQAETAG